MSKITVFTKPACVQCNATYRKLTQLGIPFESVDVSVDEAALNKIKDLGYLAAPVVLVNEGGEDEQHWSGYRPDLIEPLKA